MGKSHKSELRLKLAGRSSVSEEDFACLQAELDISETTLRRHLRLFTEEIGLVLAPLVEGVRQDTRENLERTLTRLADLYPQRDKDCRAMVLEAKRHAKFQKRDEVLLYLNIWLENPLVFSAWAKLRAKKLKGQSS